MMRWVPCSPFYYFRNFSYLSVLSIALIVSCSKAGEKIQSSELTAQTGVSAKPNDPDLGWSDDPCLSCLCTVNAFAQEVAYESLSDATHPTTEWSNRTSFCQKRNLCASFAYTQAWSPLLTAKRCVDSGLIKKWTDKSEDLIPTVCMYEHPFFGGREHCYKPGRHGALDDDLRGKVSSIRIIGSGRLVIWQESQFAGESHETRKELLPELPKGFADRVGSIELDDLATPGPSPSRLSISDAKALKGLISAAVGQSQSEDEVILKLLDTTYEKIEQLALAQKKQKYNVLVVRQDFYDVGLFESQVFTEEFKIGQKSYWVRVFRKGAFRYGGQLGWAHWGIRGKFTRTGPDGRDVTFDIPL
jgi:hypothetical protein